jgi:hypothetical protein
VSNEKQTETADIALHPELAAAAHRLLCTPGLTRDTIARIRRDMHMDKPEAEQIEMDVTDGR